MPTMGKEENFVSDPFKAMLEQASVNVIKPAKKGSMPEIHDLTPQEKEAVDAYDNAKTIFKQAKAVMDTNADILIPIVVERQDEDGFAGNFHNSYKLFGVESVVSVVASDRYSVNGDDEPEVQQLLQDAFPKLLTKTYEVRLRPEVLQNKQLQDKLMAALGSEFNVFFEVATKLTTVEGFKKSVYQFVNKEKLQQLRVFIKQARPSVK